MATKIVIGQEIATPRPAYQDGVGLWRYIACQVDKFCGKPSDACFPAFCFWLFAAVFVWIICGMVAQNSQHPAIALWCAAILTVIAPIVVVFICLAASYYTMIYRAVFVNPIICRRYDAKMTELHRNASRDMLLSHATMLQILSLYERGRFYINLCYGTHRGVESIRRACECDMPRIRHTSEFLVDLCVRDSYNENFRDELRALH